MKLYLEPVQMTLTATGSPARLIWRRKSYLIINIEEQWLHCGQWWLTPQLQGLQRHYYRVLATTGGNSPLTLELYQEAGAWMLSRVMD